MNPVRYKTEFFVYCVKGAVSLSEAALKNTTPGSVQEPGVGVKLRCETKSNASRVYSIRDWISSLLAPQYRKNYPVRRTGKITQRCLGGVGLQKAGSDLLPFGENRVLTASVIQDRAVRLLPRYLQIPGVRACLPGKYQFHVSSGRQKTTGS